VSDKYEHRAWQAGAAGEKQLEFRIVVPREARLVARQALLRRARSHRDEIG